ncbi:MAG: DUF2911 domain-containing protein [Cyclobacteriaceae bacterium]
MRLLPCIVFLLAGTAAAQGPVKLIPSPVAVVTARYKDSYIKITYSQPHKRSRVVFGQLVPFGEVWRTGANEATEITLTRDIQFGNQLLKAGSYSIFSIPDKEKWTLIINSDLGLWGAYNYNTKNDVMRIEAPVEKLTDTAWEAFTISIETRNDKASLLFRWEQTSVAVPFQFTEPKP